MTLAAEMTEATAPARAGTRSRVRIFALQFATMTAAIVAIWMVAVNVNVSVTRDRSQNAAAKSVEILSERISAHLAGFTSHLFIAARDPSLQRLLAGDPAGRSALARQFEIILQENASLVRLRYLDGRGNEIVRVDRTAGNVAIAPDAELQNQADRQYFIEGMKLGPGEVYISPLDLRTERGKVVVPWEPGLRLVTPVGAAGDGFVVINLHASDIVSLFNPSRQPPSQSSMLVNSDGFWLAGVPAEQAWGFMFDRATTLFVSDPELWQQVASRASGALQRDGSTFAFDTLRPSVVIESRVGANHVVYGDRGWKIIVEDRYDAQTAAWTLGSLAILAAALLLAGLISWSWSGSVAGRRAALANEAQAERKLIRTERMASLGEMVAGVAHELNTPIGNAVMVASTMRDQLTGFEQELTGGQVRRATLDALLSDLRTGADIILRGLTRASDLIGNFKQVAVDQTSEQRREFLLDEYVGELVTSLEPGLKHSPVRLVVHAGSGASLNSYPGPLAQVIQNLVNNAVMHGFAGGTGGTVTIATAAANDSSGTVEITVADNGAGIPPAIASRIFDPFFTTRAGTGGSGLGLSIVHNIIHDLLGGNISVTSVPGSSTVFRVVIPVTAPKPTKEDLLHVA